MQDHRAGKGHFLCTPAKAKDEPHEGVETDRAIRVRQARGSELSQHLLDEGPGSFRALMSGEDKNSVLRQSH
eukprot:5281048-Heterocapsa_arctica.AAC.1